MPWRVLTLLRLAPEHPFPTGLNDSYTALNWVNLHLHVQSLKLTRYQTKQNAGSLNADLSKGFLVGGASAGGNLAAVLAHRAKADLIFDQSPLTGQILLYPVTVHPEVVPAEYVFDCSSILVHESANPGRPVQAQGEVHRL